jgi:hypothetical protein
MSGAPISPQSGQGCDDLGMDFLSLTKLLTLTVLRTVGHICRLQNSWGTGCSLLNDGMDAINVAVGPSVFATSTVRDERILFFAAFSVDLPPKSATGIV